MRAFVIAAVTLLWAGPALAQPTYPRPAPELAASPATVELPPVPTLTPPPAPGGVHSVFGLVVRGPSIFGQKVTVRGRVVWRYDCAIHGGPSGPLGGPKATAKARKKLAAQHPELCYRPHFMIGDGTAGDGPTLWVVDLPRKPLGLKLGDPVTLSATFAPRSSSGFANAGGLLIFDRVVR